MLALQAIPPHVWTRLGRLNIDVRHEASHSVIVCCDDGGKVTTDWPGVELQTRAHDEEGT